MYELWKGEELSTLKVGSNDNGELYDASLVREPSGYAGELNGKRIELPLDAFPVAVWHYPWRLLQGSSGRENCCLNRYCG